LRYNGQTGAFLDTFVPAGTGGLDHPSGLAFGSDGHLYVSSTTTGSILRYDGGTGAFVDAFVPMGSGRLRSANGLAFGPDGNLLSAVPPPTAFFATTG
jgi:DNA-binding beta-propeller fold protein YncE